MKIRDKDLVSIQQARDLVEKAYEAQKQFRDFSQEEIDEIIRCMSEKAREESERLARMAVDETGFGVYEHKVMKNLFAAQDVYNHIKDMKTVGILSQCSERKITEIAVPVGVIAALIPTTNPTSTTIYKSLIALKAGNAIVFSPHPRAVKSILETARLLHDIAVAAGAPEGIIGCMDMPTMDGTHELMHHDKVSMILATGSSDMVKAAYSSGRPALGVGPGNVPAFIERTADIPRAVRYILTSKSFDNGTICASEQSIVTENCIRDQVKGELIRQGAYFLNPDEIKRMEKIIALPGGRINPAIVGQAPRKIGQMAGLDIKEGIMVLIAEQDKVGEKYPFSMEKLSPLLAFYSEEDWEKACERCIELLELGGKGHSLAIHSNNEKVIMEFGLKKPVYRILINTPSAQGGIGATTGIVPSLTLGCGAYGGNATSDNVSPYHLINIKRMAYGMREFPERIIETQSSPKQVTGSIQEFDIEKMVQLVLQRLK